MLWVVFLLYIQPIFSDFQIHLLLVLAFGICKQMASLNFFLQTKGKKEIISTEKLVLHAQSLESDYCRSWEHEASTLLGESLMEILLLQNIKEPFPHYDESGYCLSLRKMNSKRLSLLMPLKGFMYIFKTYQEVKFKFMDFHGIGRVSALCPKGAHDLHIFVDALFSHSWVDICAQ